MSTAIPSRPRQIGLRRTFAIIASQYNSEFVNGLVDHTRRELEAISPSFNVLTYEVPGAFEIPLVAQEVATRGDVDAMIALGVIIEGEASTPRSSRNRSPTLCNKSASPSAFPSSMKCFS